MVTSYQTPFPSRMSSKGDVLFLSIWKGRSLIVLASENDRNCDVVCVSGPKPYKAGSFHFPSLGTLILTPEFPCEKLGSLLEKPWRKARRLREREEPC